jgi:hypothetical protein
MLGFLVGGFYRDPADPASWLEGARRDFGRLVFVYGRC